MDCPNGANAALKIGEERAVHTDDDKSFFASTLCADGVNKLVFSNAVDAGVTVF